MPALPPENASMLALRTGISRILQDTAFDPLCREIAHNRWLLPATASKDAPACQAIDAVDQNCAASQIPMNIAANIAPLLRQLHWVADYPDHPVLIERFAHAELYRSETLVVGCNLTAAGTLYPLHAHVAEEIYLPVTDSGAIYQQARQKRSKAYQPGDLIYHESAEPHGLETFAKPALNLWMQFGRAPGGPTWFIDRPSG